MKMTVSIEEQGFRMPLQIQSTSKTFIFSSLQGQVWINGFNLGRFWPVRGPQHTLFVPGPFLSASSPNNITVLELQAAPVHPRVLFLDRPILNGTSSSTHKVMEQ